MDNIEWGQFLIEDLFTILRGKRFIKNDREKGEIPYYSSSETNNGLTDFISNPLFVEKDKIIVTTFGDSFFVEGKFTASDEITILGNENINKYNGLFVCEMIKNNAKKFRFGYKAFSGRLKRQTILLPLNNKEVDWDFMESYMKEKEEKLLQKYENYISKNYNLLEKNIEASLSSKNWKEFSIDEMGEIISGRDIYEKERIIGDVPYISAKSKDNGIGHFVGNDNNTLESECLSVNRNGSVGYAFYHPYKALYSNDCRKLRLNKNKYVSLFIVNQITFQKDKYGYGYKMGTGRLKRQKILLPVDDNGDPDYEFMENYMKQIESEKISEYLEYIKDRV